MLVAFSNSEILWSQLVFSKLDHQLYETQSYIFVKFMTKKVRQTAFGYYGTLLFASVEQALGFHDNDCIQYCVFTVIQRKQKQKTVLFHFLLYVSKSNTKFCHKLSITDRFPWSLEMEPKKCHWWNGGFMVKVFNSISSDLGSMPTWGHHFILEQTI